jgi:hypothetical protein
MMQEIVQEPLLSNSSDFELHCTTGLVPYFNLVVKIYCQGIGDFKSGSAGLLAIF